jgi:hypothetical protein
MDNNIPLDRRSFIKVLGSGLITAGVVTSGFMFPNSVSAYQPCTSVRCELAYGFYQCLNNCLYLVLGYFCFDTRNNEFCGSYESAGRIGSC